MGCKRLSWSQRNHSGVQIQAPLPALPQIPAASIWEDSYRLGRLPVSPGRKLRFPKKTRPESCVVLSKNTSTWQGGVRKHHRVETWGTGQIGGMHLAFQVGGVEMVLHLYRQLGATIQALVELRALWQTVFWTVTGLSCLVPIPGPPLGDTSG